MNQIEFLRRCIAISQAGMAYTKDRFDQERYADLHQLALQQLSTLGRETPDQLTELFANEAGYPTPKVDVRAFIQRANTVLLVEDTKGKWALPGGFAEVGYSPRANVAKEVHEETGLTMTVGSLRAIYDTALRTDIPQTFQYYKMIFAGTVDDKQFAPNNETITMDWFTLEKLPPLSLKRTTLAQLQQLFQGSMHID